MWPRATAIPPMGPSVAPTAMAVAERGPGLRAPLGDIRIVRIASVFSCVLSVVCIPEASPLPRVLVLVSVFY